MITEARKTVLTMSDPDDLAISGKISKFDEDIFLKEMRKAGIAEEEIQYHSTGAGNTDLFVAMMIPVDKKAEFLKTLKEGELNNLGIAQKLMMR